jgi:hypothetical protein
MNLSNRSYGSMDAFLAMQNEFQRMKDSQGWRNPPLEKGGKTGTMGIRKTTGAAVCADGAQPIVEADERRRVLSQRQPSTTAFLGR